MPWLSRRFPERPGADRELGADSKLTGRLKRSGAPGAGQVADDDLEVIKAKAPNSPTVCSSATAWEGRSRLERRRRLEHGHLAEGDELIQRGRVDGPAPFPRRQRNLRERDP